MEVQEPRNEEGGAGTEANTERRRGEREGVDERE